MKTSKLIFFSLLIISAILSSCSTSRNSVSNHNAMTVSNNSNNNLDILAGTSWSIDGNAFFNKEKASYTLTPSNPDDDFEFGYFVDFDEEGGFYGHYDAPCGNDCFTTINGTYSIVNGNEIKVFIKLAEQEGYCNTKTTIKNKDMGTFKIEEQPKKALLLKRL